MDLGEKLTSIVNIIYANASVEFEKNNIPISLAPLLIDCVHNKFVKDGYDALLLQKLQSEQTPPEEEIHTGSAEELIEEFEQNGAVREKCST